MFVVTYNIVKTPRHSLIDGVSLAKMIWRCEIWWGTLRRHSSARLSVSIFGDFLIVKFQFLCLVGFWEVSRNPRTSSATWNFMRLGNVPMKLQDFHECNEQHLLCFNIEESPTHCNRRCIHHARLKPSKESSHVIASSSKVFQLKKSRRAHHPLTLLSRCVRNH